MSFKTATELDSSDVKAWFNLSRVMAKLGTPGCHCATHSPQLTVVCAERYEPALQAVQRVLQLRPGALEAVQLQVCPCCARWHCTAFPLN